MHGWAHDTDDLRALSFSDVSIGLQRVKLAVGFPRARVDVENGLSGSGGREGTALASNLEDGVGVSL